MQMFGDGFDLYAATADAAAAYWDSGSAGGNNGGVSATTRFGVGRGWYFGNNGGTCFTKSSGANDAVHHVVVAININQNYGNTGAGPYFTFADGATNQCTVYFRLDGTVLLQSGSIGGATLATYANAIPIASTWYAFEFEVVVNNATGSFAVRTNGATANSFSATGLNTRAGSTNNYASKLVVGYNGFPVGPVMDDLLWRSDPSSVPWVGDIRCYTRMPVSDQGVQFSKSPSSLQFQLTPPQSNATGPAGNVLQFMPFTAPVGIFGPVQSIIIRSSAGFTGNAVCGLYDATGTGGGPGNLLTNGTTSVLVNGIIGNNIFTFATPPTITVGTKYFVALNGNVSISVYGAATDPGVYRQSYTYTGSLPSTGASAILQAPNVLGSELAAMLTPLNAFLCSEPQQDGATTLVYDSTPGDADFYGVAPLGFTPASIIGVTARGFAQKGDAGSRTGTVQLKSSATTVQAPNGQTLLNTSFGWVWGAYLNDPNTGAGWTASAVNSLQVGPKVLT
jgi:hypothetical protein